VLLGRPLLFFGGWPPATRQSHTVGGPILQLGVEFSSASTDSVHVHTCDLGHQSRTAMPQILGLQGHVPSPLLLIQATEQQVHLVVQFLVWMIVRLLAIRTLALMDRTC
jgi:hypothetical protein